MRTDAFCALKAATGNFMRAAALEVVEAHSMAGKIGHAYIGHVNAVSIGGEERSIGCAGDSSGIRDDCDSVEGVIPSSIVLNCEDIALVDVHVGNFEVDALQEGRTTVSLPSLATGMVPFFSWHR